MQDEKQVRVHLLVRTACADSDRIKSQLCTLRAHAAEKGWVVAGETVEDGVGGISLDRQGLGKILALAASPAPPFSILLVVSTDRIARNITVMSAVLRHLEQNGITIQTLEGCLSKAPFGRTCDRAMARRRKWREGDSCCPTRNLGAGPGRYPRMGDDRSGAGASFPGRNVRLNRAVVPRRGLNFRTRFPDEASNRLSGRSARVKGNAHGQPTNFDARN